MLSKREALPTLLLVLTFPVGLAGQALTFSATTYASGGSNTNTVAVADFNKDGALDVVASNSGTAFVNSSSPNYTGWLGQFTTGHPNGQLQASGSPIPFFFPGGDTQPGADRALNVMAGRFPPTNGGTAYPSIYGATGGPNVDTNRGPRNGSPLNAGKTGFTTSGVGFTLTLLGSGKHTSWVAAGDFNGDGVDDGVATHSDLTNTPTSDIAVYSGVVSFGALSLSQTAAITFNLPGGLTGFSAAAGDLNGDNKADIVVATNSPSIVIYRSTSTVSPFAFSFAAPVTIGSLGANSKYITIADVNGDHKPDIIIATGGTSVIVLPNDGTGGFSSGTKIVLDMGAGTSMCAAVADLTHDGFPDVAVANGSGQIQVFRGKSDHTFDGPVAYNSTTANAVWVAAADMNADGRPDLVVASSSDALVSVMLNTTTLLVPGPSTINFYAAVNGSNPPAQVVNVSAGTYTSSVNTNGTGSWLSAGVATSGPVTISVNIAGLAAKVYRGTVTLASTDPFNTARIFVTLNVAEQSGTLTSTSFPVPNSGGALVAVGDFNNDGINDVVMFNGFNNTVACSGNNSLPAVIYIQGNGSGGVGDGTFASTGSQIGSCLNGAFQGELLFAAADFNGDGNLDIAMMDGNGTALMFAFGDGAGHFTLNPSQYVTSGGATPTGLYVADMNNDGAPDVVAITTKNQIGLPSFVDVYLNDGTGKDFNHASYAVGSNSFPGAIGDFNKDGFLDVVVPNLASNNISFLTGAGGGILNAATTISSCNQPLSVAAGDFNKDGNLDILAGCNNTGNIETFLGNGNGTFQAGTFSTIASGIPMNLFPGDFDGDGNLDLFFNKQGQGLVNVILGNGTGGFIPSTVADFTADSFTTPLVFYPVDVNGDGRLDAFYPRSGIIGFRVGDKAATSTSVSSNPLNSAIAGQSVAFIATTNTTVPSWAKATGTTTINDTVAGQVGQGNAVAGVFTVNAALSIGVHSLSDTYAGDGRTKPSNSAANYPFTVNAAHLAFTTQPVSTAAGATMADIVVKVQDTNNLTVTTSTASITLTLSSNNFSAGTTTLNAVAGVATFSGLKIGIPGNNYTITASSAPITSAISNQFNIAGGALAKFAVAGYPSPTTAGAAHNFTVTAQDAGSNTVTNYTGTVTFSSSDIAAGLPLNYTFVLGDNGVHTFSATLKTVGTRSITATDFNNNAITGSQTNIDVQLGPPASITPSGTPQSAVVGNAFSAISALVKDAGGNVLSGVDVTFQMPGAGASCLMQGSAQQIAATDVNGVSSPPDCVANLIAGSYVFTASVGQLAANFNFTNLPDVPASMIITGGDNQSTAINTPFPNPLKVMVKDIWENPVSGAPITFTAPASGASGIFPGSLIVIVVNSDANGLATSPVFTANATAGGYQVVASTPGNPFNPLAGLAQRFRPQAARATPRGVVQLVTANFNLTNLKGAPANLIIVDGNNQSAGLSTAYPVLLKVQVTDSGNNPLSGLTVTFTAPASGPRGTFAGNSTTFSANTDASGFVTTSTLTTGTVSGTFNVGVSCSGLNQTFTETVTPGPVAAITVFAGDNQSTAVGQAYATNLAAKVTDAFSNPIGGVGVQFTPPASGASGSFTGPTTINTLSTGVATVGTLTANSTPGSFQVNAKVAANPALNVNFSETNLVGAPAFMTIVAGNNQSVVVGNAFPANLGVKVTDAQLNPLSGVAVTFAPPASGASGSFAGAPPIVVNTNGSGIAMAPGYTANTIAGSNAPKATAGALSATFTETNLPDAPVSMTPFGTPQTTIISTPFATPLSVKIADQFGNGVSSQSVLFTAPGTGASGTFPGPSATATVSTDAGGNAVAPTFTANGNTGAYIVSATRGALSASFNLTNITSIVGITTRSGSGQLAGPTQPFGSPLVAFVYDGNGNGVPNAVVTFTMPSTGPSASFNVGSPGTFTAATNSQGLVTSPFFTANGNAGTFSIVATTGAFSATFIEVIGTPPATVVTPTLLIFYSEIGQPPPKTQFVNVQAPLQTYTFQVDSPWLKVSILPNGVLKDTLQVNIDPTGLPPGHFDGNIVINDVSAIVRVDLHVLPKPQINPSARRLSFQYTQGQGIPSEQVVYLTATTRNFNVMVTENYLSPAGAAGWLKVIGDGNSTTPAPLHVNIVPDSLPPGTYEAVIHVVAADATNSPFDIPVTMVIVAGPPTIAGGQ